MLITAGGSEVLTTGDTQDHRRGGAGLRRSLAVTTIAVEDGSCDPRAPRRSDGGRQGATRAACRWSRGSPGIGIWTGARQWRPPGLIDTPMMHTAYGKERDAIIKNRAAILLGKRVGTAHEAAQVLLML